MSKLYLLLFLLFSISMLSAQKRLKLDINKWGGAVYFDVGEEIEFQLKESKDWYRYKITGMNYETQSLIFDELELPVSRIQKLFVIRKKTRNAVYGGSSLLLTFGTVWTAYAIYGAIVGSPMVGVGTFVVGGIAIGAGAALMALKVLWKRRYKINKKHRLRVVDWTMEKDMASVSTIPLIDHYS
jgi:hypothetical protein